MSIEDTFKLRIDRPNCVRFEARGLSGGGGVTIRDPVKHTIRPPPSYCGRRGPRNRSCGFFVGPQYRTWRKPNDDPRQQHRVRVIAACELHHASGRGDLPWEVTCCGVVDGIDLVIHVTRRHGRSYVQEALQLNGYSAEKQLWYYTPLGFSSTEVQTIESLPGVARS